MHNKSIPWIVEAQKFDAVDNQVGVGPNLN